MLLIAPDSHTDHGLTEAQVAYVLAKYQDKNEFFIDTLDLPEDLGLVPCRLHGPVVGDDPVPDDECRMEIRGSRPWYSRVCDRPERSTRVLTVIAGPHDGHSCVLYTAFGGPLAPRETGDPACDRQESAAFWAEHALTAETVPPEELTAGPTIEPAPERVTTCTRSAPCQVRRDQDEVLAAHPGDATCALLRRDEDGWGLYVDGDLVTLIDYCPWCGGRLA